MSSSKPDASPPVAGDETRDELDERALDAACKVDPMLAIGASASLQDARRLLVAAHVRAYLAALRPALDRSDVRATTLAEVRRAVDGVARATNSAGWHPAVIAALDAIAAHPVPASENRSDGPHSVGYLESKQTVDSTHKSNVAFASFGCDRPVVRVGDARPAPEPVAWQVLDKDGRMELCYPNRDDADNGMASCNKYLATLAPFTVRPLYAAPPASGELCAGCSHPREDHEADGPCYHRTTQSPLSGCLCSRYAAPASAPKEASENIARNYVPERESLTCGDEVAVLTFRDRVALIEAGRHLRPFDDLDVLRALCGEAAACVDEVDNDAARELAVRLRQAWNGQDPVGDSSAPASGEQRADDVRWLRLGKAMIALRPDGETYVLESEALAALRARQGDGQ